MSEPFDIEAARRRAAHGCGDSSCTVKRPTGMHTNGGCRCWPERSLLKSAPLVAQEVVDAYEAGAAARQAEIVAWLRRGGGSPGKALMLSQRRRGAEFADAIEAGPPGLGTGCRGELKRAADAIEDGAGGAP